jgi:sugar lactone lactonase YvrE
VAVFDGRGPIVWPGRLALGGGALFVSDPRTHRVARVGLEDGAVEVVAGSGGPGLDRDGRALEVPLSHPAGIAVDGERLWIADLGNRALRAVDLSGGTIATVAGGWDATRTVHEGGFFRSPDRFLPSDLAFGRGGELLVLDLRERGVLELDPESGQLEPVAGTTNLSETGNTGVDWRVAARRDFAVDPDGRLLFAEGPAGRVVRCSADGGREVLPAARLAWPAAVDVDREGRVYVVDAGRGILSRVDPDGSASTLWRSETPSRRTGLASSSRAKR